MRRLLPFFFIILAACNSNSDKKADQKNEPGKYIVSMDGLDELKIGMKQEELEKILNQKLVLKNAASHAVSWEDTVTVKYKDITPLLHFMRAYPNGGDTSFYMYLTGIESSNKLCKTDAGIGIGDSKEKIIDAYPGNLMSLGPDYVSDTSAETSKTKYIVRVKNETGNRGIIFHLENKKVSALETGVIFHDSE